MYLAKIGFLPMCEQLFEKCITSSEVSRELLRKEYTPERPVLEKAFKSWLMIEEPKNPTRIQEFRNMGIHLGEAEIIAIAQNIPKHPAQDKEDPIPNRAVIIIDDLDGREISRGLQLPVTGTIGVLLFATRRNIILPLQCEKFLDELVGTTFYLSAQMLLSIRHEIDLIKQDKTKL
jgi:predicted nucleic acid-binding protein